MNNCRANRTKRKCCCWMENIYYYLRRFVTKKKVCKQLATLILLRQTLCDSEKLPAGAKILLDCFDTSDN